MAAQEHYTLLTSEDYWWRRTGWRILLVGVLIVAAHLAVVARHFQLVWAPSAEIQTRAQLPESGASSVAFEQKKFRGSIYDRNAFPLAISQPTRTLAIDVRTFEDKDENWRQIADLVDMDWLALKKRFRSAGARRLVFMQRQLDLPVVAQLSALQMPGVKLIEEHKRYYPVGEIVAPVIGLAGIDGQGQEGIEVLFDRYLTSGATKVRKRSRAGQIPIPQRLTEPDMFAVAHGTDGTARQGRFARKSVHASGAQDVHLTLDIDAQYLAYRTLKKAVVASGAQAGTLVAVDVVTGEVLAMVSYPSYNPNDRRELQVQRNRVAMDQIEPGSVLKPFTVAAALESGSWSQGKSVDTNPGYIKLSKGVHFADTENHGVMSLSEVLTRSSQVAAAKLALSMHPQPYMRLLKSWGFGRQTGIGLPAEAEGNLPTAFGLSKVDQAAVGFGYGCTVTALQLAQAYSVLGNEGMLVPLRLVKGMSMQASQRVMSRKVARSVLSMLEQAVQHGTGRRARIDGYRVAGKTGTVHLTGRDGYEQDRYRALFAGLVPVSRPRIAMVVTIEEPNPNRYFGGVVAAPVFATVARQLLMRLRVVPDMTYASAG